MSGDAARKRVLVTGGASGLGAAIVRALAASGHDVALTYRSSASEAEALVASLRAEHADAAFAAHPLDLSDRIAVDAFCDEVASQPFFGLVHNAGQSADALAAMLDQDRAESAMQVNFWSLTRIAKALLRGMIRARTGRIVAIGSVAALQANTGNAAYAATKGALISYCRTLALESAKRGITVNVIAPGFVDTAMLAPYAAHRDGIERQIPVGRFARPEEVAALARFLMRDEAAYITGAVLPVDGGLTASMGLQRS